MPNHIFYYTYLKQDKGTNTYQQPYVQRNTIFFESVQYKYIGYEQYTHYYMA